MEKLKEIFKQRTTWLIILLLAAAILFYVFITKRSKEDEQSKFAEQIKADALKDKITEKEQELNQYMRKLWAENAFWTRNYIISYMADGNDIKDVAKRLLKNQDQISRALGLWYGDESGSKISKLLGKNTTAFGDTMMEMKRQNKNGAIVAEKKWQDTTDELVSYLSNLNEHFNKSDMSHNFKKMNEMTITQAMARYRKQHDNEIKSFDKTYNHAIYDVSDSITKGIVSQYPDKFDKSKK